MIFTHHGNPNLPVFILLHGGGLSDWSLIPIVDRLSAHYCLVTPVIDGHAEDAATPFLSIEDSAGKLIRYIHAEHRGHVFAIGGLSLGAQIILEVLSRQADIARYAVVESALVIPIPGAAAWSGPVYGLFYSLVRRRWFARLQAQSLFVPAEQFEAYFRDSARMTKQSLINMIVSNATYRIQPELHHTLADALILAGQKELPIILKSARLLRAAIPSSELYIASGLKHGELSLRNPDRFVQVVKDFMARKS